MQSSDGPSPDARSRWKPTHHERYFVILGDESIQNFPWNGTDFDLRAQQFGNCFSRRTTAEQARHAIQELLLYFQQEQG